MRSLLVTVAGLVVGATSPCGCGIGVVGGMTSAASVDAEPLEGQAPVDGVEAGARLDAAAPLGPCSDPTLILCMRFEDSMVDEAKGQAIDVTGTVTYTAGIDGKAVVMDANDELLISDNPAWSYAALTVEAWVRPAVIPASGRAGILDKDGSFGLFLYPGNVLTCTMAGSASANIAGAGEWVHVACSNDGTKTRLYVDGVERASADAAPLSITGAVVSVGGDSPNGDRLNGAMDTLRVFARARSAAEIAAAARR